MMLIDPNELSIKDMYGHLVRMIVPRPIAWVSTVSPKGIDNIAPYSFFNGIGANPPTVCFSPVNKRTGEKKDTIINIEANKQFVINVVPYKLSNTMNETAFEYDSEVSEFEATGLSTVKSQRVAPPRLKESPIQLECELVQIVNLGEGPLAANLVIGKILLAHIDDEVLDADGQIDPDKLDLVGRMGGADYCYTRDRFPMARPLGPGNK